MNFKLKFNLTIQMHPFGCIFGLKFNSLCSRIVVGIYRYAQILLLLVSYINCCVWNFLSKFYHFGVTNKMKATLFYIRSLFLNLIYQSWCVKSIMVNLVDIYLSIYLHIHLSIYLSIYLYNIYVYIIKTYWIKQR